MAGENIQRNLVAGVNEAGKVQANFQTVSAETVVNSILPLKRPLNPQYAPVEYVQKDCKQQFDVGRRELSDIWTDTLEMDATAHILMRSAALNNGVATVGAAPVLPETRRSHAVVRSLAAQRPAFTIIDGYDDDTTYRGTKYDQVVVDGLKISMKPREAVQLSLGIVGSANTNQVSGAYVHPECVIKPALLGQDCALSIGNVDISEIWESFDFEDNPGVYKGDDPFTGRSKHIKRLRDGIRTFSLQIGVVGTEGDAVYLKAKNREVLNITTRFGDALGTSNTEESATLIAHVRLRLAPGRRTFTGEAGRSGYLVIGDVERVVGDSLTPVSWIGKLIQPTPFLEVYVP